ncbi:hypothetical protein ACPW7J_09570 [Ihubacter sp. rT4E-8]|uniref:hypothetical protein n=1 Tax=Ihubacter sp. rT4E-8 TaxID=3242369 RepID=UPI003CED3776
MTGIKKIRGVITDSEKSMGSIVIVRFTSNKFGETLSLEANDIMITVRFADIERVIKKVRN